MGTSEELPVLFVSWSVKAVSPMVRDTHQPQALTLNQEGCHEWQKTCTTAERPRPTTEQCEDRVMTDRQGSGQREVQLLNFPWGL